MKLISPKGDLCPWGMLQSFRALFGIALKCASLPSLYHAYVLRCFVQAQETWCLIASSRFENEVSDKQYVSQTRFKMVLWVFCLFSNCMYKHRIEVRQQLLCFEGACCCISLQN